MRARLVPLPLLILAAVLCGLPQAARAGDQADGGSMRMFRDPVEGRIGPPSAAALQAAEPAVAPPPAEALREEAVRAAPGGVKVNLRGRLRAAVSRQAGGSATHECVQDTADE